MTTQHGYFQSQDLSQTYNIKDQQGDLPKPVIHNGTPLSVIFNQPKCRWFADLFTDAKFLAAQYNTTQATFTVFVPIGGFYTSQDSRRTILGHTARLALTPDVLLSSPTLLIDSRIPSVRILVEHNHDTIVLNRHSKVLESIIVDNGSVIYLISEALRL